MSVNSIIVISSSPFVYMCLHKGTKNGPEDFLKGIKYLASLSMTFYPYLAFILVFQIIWIATRLQQTVTSHILDIGG